MMSKVVYLDRDGVINENRDDYVKSWGEFVFQRGSVDALRRLRQAGCRLVVVTNQSGVARGLFSPQTLEEIHSLMQAELKKAGAEIDLILTCPHHPDEQCCCRKPEIGLFQRAEERLALGTYQGFLVGDSLTDMRAGRRAGCRTILVLTGKPLAKPLWRALEESHPDHICWDLADAADYILDRSG